ncbi:MAG: SIR2 family protein [Nitrospinae bacterium]|nr:SIR2 family protein [Nitrospinota bacterium]
MRVTAFIGAGAIIDIGGPTTHDITNKVRSVQQDIFDTSAKCMVPRPFIEEVAQHLSSFWGIEPNFEDIFHALEMLDSCRVGWDIKAAKEFRPALSGFVDSIDDRFFDQMALMIAKNDLIKTVAEQIDSYDAAFNPNVTHSWYADFWRQATNKLPWDIATINYDTCIDKSLHGYTSYEDGFEYIEAGLHKFCPNKVCNSDKTKIIHLHGCIYYGYPPPYPDPNRFIFEYQHEDLFKFSSYLEARKSWFHRSRALSQAGEQTTVGPIVTGLRKTDKLLPYPYNAYNTCFTNSIMGNNRLLIVGYSFGDLHFNNWFERIVNIHGDNRKIVIIYLDNPKYLYSDIGDKMCRFLLTVFKKKRVSEFIPFGSDNPVVSGNGCVRLYLRGFNDAVKNHGSEIIDFLGN